MIDKSFNPFADTNITENEEVALLESTGWYMVSPGFWTHGAEIVWKQSIAVNIETEAQRQLGN